MTRCYDGGSDVGYARFHTETCHLSDDACRIADNPAESPDLPPLFQWCECDPNTPHGLHADDNGIIRATLAGVRITADPDGSVSTMSDWTRADDLVRAGVLTRRDFGPDTYGAATYHLPR